MALSGQEHLSSYLKQQLLHCRNKNRDYEMHGRTHRYLAELILFNLDFINKSKSYLNAFVLNITKITLIYIYIQF